MGLLLAASTACTDPTTTGPAEEAPRPVASAGLAEDRVVDDVLAECHAPLRGGMDRVSVTVELPDGEQLLVHAHLPHSLRAVGPSGKFLLRDDGAFRLDEPVGPADPDRQAKLRQLMVLVDRAALGPLYRAEACRRIDTTSFALTQRDSDPITLVLRPETLLPARIGDVGIDEYLRTPVTWIPKVVTHPELGRCALVFEQSDINWRPGFFAAPGTAIANTGPRIKLTTGTDDSRSSTPVFADARAVRWLVLDDPGDWNQRAEIYTPLHDLLLAEGQRIAGFPIFTEIDDRAVLAIPFRARKAGNDPRLPAGSRVVELAPARELVVFPPAGDLATRREAGEAALRQVARANDLEFDGAIRWQPYIHLHEGPPTTAKLADPTVRMSVRLR